MGSRSVNVSPAMVADMCALMRLCLLVPSLYRPSHAPPVVYVPSEGQESLVVVSVQPGHSAIQIDNITVGYSHGVLCDLAKLA